MSIPRLRAARMRAMLLGRQSPVPASDLTARALSVVEHFGAMQAQEARSGLYSLGVRLPGVTEAHLTALLAGGHVVRTWPMRGTLHLVPGRDVTWMLAATGSRTRSAYAATFANAGLDDSTVAALAAAVTSEMSDGQPRTREQLAELTRQESRVSSAYLAVLALALEGVLVTGAGSGAAQQFYLASRHLPPQVALNTSEALIELAWRFYRSHGPASLNDFAGWAGIGTRAAGRAVDDNAGRLVRVFAAGQTLILPTALAAAMPDLPPPRSTLLLPGFDEFLLGVKDRSLVLRPVDRTRVVPGGNGVFKATVVVNGRVVGTWARDETQRRVTVRVTMFPGQRAPHAALHAAAGRYGAFLSLPAVLAQEPLAT